MNASRTVASKDTYWTPEKILAQARLVQGGNFALDPATDPRNPTRAASFCVPAPDAAPDAAYVDGLAQDWTVLANGGMVWVNPPFGREKIAFLRKAHAEAKNGCQIQMIVPCDPATQWWQNYCSPRLTAVTAVCYLRQRVTFLDPDTQRPPVDSRGRGTSAMFGSNILYWGSAPKNFFDAWAAYGDVDLAGS